MSKHLRRWPALALAIALVASACGGTDDGTDAGAETTSSETSTASASTTEAETTTLPPSTTTSTTATTSTEPAVETAPEPPIEEQLAAGLLVPDDLPSYFATTFENGFAEERLADVPGPCGLDGPLGVESFDARQSLFMLGDGAQWADQRGGFVIAQPVVRYVGVDADSVVDLASELAAGCDGETVTAEQGPQVSTPVEVAALDGVSGAGWLLVPTEGNDDPSGLIVGLLGYTFRVGSLDGYLLLSGAALDVADLEVLAEPIVEAFQGRLAACAADTDVCAWPG